jgi:hypothetical protein
MDSPKVQTSYSIREQSNQGAFRVNVSHSGKALIASLALFAFSILCARADDFDSWHEFESNSYPVPARAGFHAVERLGITIGGDVISRLTRSDGTYREISAGGLYQAGLGVLYQWDAIPFSAELTFNYHVNSDYNGNDNASFRRNPLEALVYFNGLGRFRIGGGMRHVYAARATSSLNGVNEKITFANTTGSIVEIGYQVVPYGWINLRYVKETYTIASLSTTSTTPPVSGNTPYDGSHYGLFISYEY